MFSKKILVTSLFVFASFATSALALPPRVLTQRLRGVLESMPAEGKATLADVDLGRDALDTIELEPMEVWAKDAKIIAFGPGGEERILPPPAIKYFKGRVTGEDESAVFVSMSEDGSIRGLVLLGERRWALGSGVRRVERGRHRDGEAVSPVLIAEIDAIDDIGDLSTQWKCEVDGDHDLPQVHLSNLTTNARGKYEGNAGNVAGATYQLRIAVETDDEFCAAFGNDTTALTTYIGDLLGKASTVYSRDLKTTLVVGETHLRTGGAGTDPWTVGTGSGTGAALAQFGTYWHNNYPLASVPRSSAIFLSGKAFSGGVAWINTLCDDDLFCGAGGANCGSATYANAYAGGYAFNGSTGTVTTTVPDPTLTINGIEYGLPTGSSFWMLLEVMHELGHNASSPHSSCVALTMQEQTNYGVPGRTFVDLCLSGQSGCYSGPTSAPAEKGTIMSYCHNIFYSGSFRASRYLFGKAGEPSEKMFPIFTAGLEAATPNPTITTQAEPVACSSGRTASVATCTGCTYAWQITGGTITSATNIASITYTPSTPSVVLTATVTTERGCGITASKTVSTSCASILPPTGVAATATNTTTVNVLWNAAAGATSYNVYRSSDGISYALAGSTASTSLSDTGRTPNTAYLYKVRSSDGNESADSLRDLAVTTIFTDDPIVADTTRAKAVHLTELRTAVDAVRTLASLGVGSYTDTIIANTTKAKALHITELRTALDAARALLTLSALTYGETLTAGVTTVKASHLTELRNGVK